MSVKYSILIEQLEVFISSKNQIDRILYDYENEIKTSDYRYISCCNDQRCISKIFIQRPNTIRSYFQPCLGGKSIL